MIEGIRALVAEGHQVTIGTVLSTINIKDIPAIFALTEQLGMRCATRISGENLKEFIKISTKIGLKR